MQLFKHSTPFYAAASLYVSSIYCFKFGINYSTMIGVMVICFSALYARNAKFVRFGAWEAAKAYLLFILAQIASVCLLSMRVDKGLFTLLVVNAIAPVTHCVSHLKAFRNICDYIGVIAFHDRVHHQLEVSRKASNIYREAQLNVFATSFLWFPLSWKYCDKLVCLQFGLWYASFHLINQRLLESPQHKQHHKDKFTNFGFDYIDVLYNTKGDNQPEYSNTAAVNVIVISSVIYLIKRSQIFKS